MIYRSGFGKNTDTITAIIMLIAIPTILILFISEGTDLPRGKIVLAIVVLGILGTIFLSSKEFLEQDN